MIHPQQWQTGETARRRARVRACGGGGGGGGGVCVLNNSLANTRETGAPKPLDHSVCFIDWCITVEGCELVKTASSVYCHTHTQCHTHTHTVSHTHTHTHTHTQGFRECCSLRLTWNNP